ncbi:ABC transporter permease subunit [Bacillus spongiae]|uniref:ABC transporter permease subunit n=1 Tax=Bacillus spongiae TaxID=2683610 RepID=A0ABU8HHR0_9BACI
MHSWILKRLTFPLLIIIGLLIASFLVPILYPEYDEIMDWMTDEKGKLIAAPPFSTDEMPPLGSDKLGRNFLLILLTGAKYTLMAAVVISLFRMILGFVFALFYTFLPAFFTRTIKGFGETFQYIPLAIIVFSLLIPLDGAFQAGSLPSDRYFFIQMMGIVALTFPSLGIYLGEEMKLYMNQEFIEASKSIGANRFQLMKKHLLPQFRRHSIVLFSEQVSQTLSLLIQLGILLMALGGISTVDFAFMWDPSNPASFSQTNEWAATISLNIKQAFINPILVIVPLTLFAILILCVNSISSTLRRALIDHDYSVVKKKKKDEKKVAETTVSKEQFTFKN